MKKQANIKIQASVDEFNSKYSIGEAVNVMNDFGDIESDIIRAHSVIMCGSATAWLEKKGSYLMERVSKK